MKHTKDSAIRGCQGPVYLFNVSLILDGFLMLARSIGNFHRLFFKTAHLGEILCGETYVKLLSLKNKHYIKTDIRTRLKKNTPQMPEGNSIGNLEESMVENWKGCLKLYLSSMR